ncbi:MAG TPA: potassium channel protein [Candidatus Acidoferrum sp.]|nr:potassium channel protein [Candidatus Acidoferrum sp.]
MSTRHRIELALIILAVVLLTGTAGFHFVEHWSWFDGFYMTLTTMTLLRSGETHPLTHAGRIFDSFLIVCTVTAVGFAIATISQALLEFEFGKAIGRRRMERELSKISGHYIVCGAGRVGRTVARQLHARGAAVVIIEKDPVRARWAEEEKIPVVIGNASSEDNLRKARIDTAEGFVSAVASDAENIYIVLTARGLRPDLKILARASEEEATSKLLRAGASQVLSPYHFIGHRMAQLLLRPNVLDFVDAAFGRGHLDFEIGEVNISGTSNLIGKKLGESEIPRQAGVIVLALRNSEGKMIFNPPPESVIHADDCLIVIGGDEQLRRLESLAS